MPADRKGDGAFEKAMLTIYGTVALDREYMGETFTAARIAYASKLWNAALDAAKADLSDDDFYFRVLVPIVGEAGGRAKTEAAIAERIASLRAEAKP